MEKSPGRRYKDELFSQFARIGKALGSPQRLEFLDLLAHAEWSVEALAHETQQSVANTSRHLQILRSARLVETRRQGVTIFYRVADPSVLQLWYAMRDLGSLRLAEVDKLINAYLYNRNAMEAVSCTELEARLRADTTLVLDVRTAQEFDAGHIVGARSIPLSELASRLAELPKTTEIIAYCRGPFCVLAAEAVAQLQASGFQARRLEGGFPEWQNEGLPVTVH
ncbi:MAG: metalloregulator ArsR/SmtB family transcription factor [Anaerolineales bacterium]|nr:metalloregulator ArsR/SmtB family transcription factor [Anaerolineales bacterium]